MKWISSRRPSPAMIVALLALFVSLSGVSYGVATGFIDSREIKNNEVRSIDIRNNQIRSKDIRNNVPDTDGGNIPNYYDYKLGVTYDMSKFAGAGVTLAGAVVGASKKESFKFSSDGQSVNKARFIVTLIKTL